MNIKDFKASLDYMFKAELTAFVWGKAGIGKSTVVKQSAQEKGFKFFPFYLGTMSDVGDVLGLASFVKDKDGNEVATQFAPPIWLKEMIDYCNTNPDSGAVILLDEFNRARRDILNGMFSLALDKTFHTIKLPKNCHIIAAGNSPTDEYNTTDINETALMARFVHIKLEPTFKEWTTFAKNVELEPTLVSFLQEQPDLLEDAGTPFNLPVKVDRRSYERLSRLFKLETPPDLLSQLASGIIGAERWVAYKQHLQKSDKPLTGKEVLSGEHKDKIKAWSDPTNVKSSLLSITSDNLYETLCSFTNLNMDGVASGNLLEFLQIIPKEVVYPLFVKFMEKDVKIFIDFTEDKRYKKKVTDIVKAAKGITKK